MTAHQLERHIFNLYRADWMTTNGYTLDDLLVSVLSEVYIPDDYAEPEQRESHILRSVEAWEKDTGFGGDIWDSFGQFIKHGFRDLAYIEHLLLHDKTYGAELLPLYHKRLNELLRADKIS